MTAVSRGPGILGRRAVCWARTPTAAECMIESPPNLAGTTLVNRAVQPECCRFYKMREVAGHDRPAIGGVAHVGEGSNMGADTSGRAEEQKARVTASCRRNSAALGNPAFLCTVQPQTPCLGPVIPCLRRNHSARNPGQSTFGPRHPMEVCKHPVWDRRLRHAVISD